MAWRPDKEWTLSFEPGIRQAVREFGGNFFDFQPATPEQDMHMALDYVLEAVGVFLCTRIYRFGTSFGQGYYTFTLRYERPSKAQTEWEKIVDQGFGDYYFVGWGISPPWPAAGMFLDLNKMRDDGAFKTGWHTRTTKSDGVIFKYLPLHEVHRWCLGCFNLGRYVKKGNFDHTQRRFRYNWTDREWSWSFLEGQDDAG